MLFNQKFENIIRNGFEDRRVVIEPPPGYVLRYPGNGYEEADHNLGLAVTEKVFDIAKSKNEVGLSVMLDDLTSGRGREVVERNLDKKALLQDYVQRTHDYWVRLGFYNQEAGKNESQPVEGSVVIEGMGNVSGRVLYTLESGYIEKALDICNFLHNKGLLEDTHSGKGWNLKGYPDINILNSRNEPSCPLLDSCFALLKLEEFEECDSFVTVHPESFIKEQSKMLTILQYLIDSGYIENPQIKYTLLTYNLKQISGGGHKIQYAIRTADSQNNIRNLK